MEVEDERFGITSPLFVFGIIGLYLLFVYQIGPRLVIKSVWSAWKNVKWIWNNINLLPQYWRPTKIILYTDIFNT